MRLIITESQFDEMFIGKKVMVYYNLHKHTFSVRYEGKVVMHADFVKLGDVEFRVRQGGKEKVRDEKSKKWRDSKSGLYCLACRAQRSLCLLDDQRRRVDHDLCHRKRLFDFEHSL